MSKQRAFLVYAASIFVPLALLAVYYATALDYPRHDDAYYLDTASRNYTEFLKHGISEGLWQVYIFRSKPILHPAIGVFFFGLTGGNALLAAVACTSFFYLLFLTYTWRILARTLKGIRLALATTLIGTVPWIFVNAFSFNSEMPMLAAVAPAVYYLLESRNFSRLRESWLAGLWTGIVLCTRPVETIMVGTVPVLVLAWRAYKLRHCSRTDMATCAIMTAICVAALVHQILTHEYSIPEQQLAYLLLEGTLLIPLFASMRQKRRHTSSSTSLFRISPFVVFFAVFLGVSVAWYAPYANVVYEWIIRSTFGEFAVISGNRTGMGRLEFISRVIFDTGTVTSAWLILIGALGFMKNPPRLDIVMLAVVAYLVPILIGSLTTNGDNRYYYSGGYILFLAVTIWALRANAPLRVIRQVLAAFLIIIQVLALLVPLRDGGQINYPYLSYFTNPFVHKSLVLPNKGATPRLVDTLAPYLPKTLPENKEEVIICLLQTRRYTDLDWVADAPAMSVISRERGFDWHFIRPWPWFDSTTEARYARTLKECDYMIALPLNYLPAPVEHFMSDVGEHVIKRFQAGKLSKDGLEFVAKLEYTAADWNKGELILVKVIRKEH